MTVAQSNYERFWMLANAYFQAHAQAIKDDSDSMAGYAHALGEAMRDATQFSLDQCVGQCRARRATCEERKERTMWLSGKIAGYDRAIYYLQGGVV